MSTLLLFVCFLAGSPTSFSVGIGIGVGFGGLLVVILGTLLVMLAYNRRKSKAHNLSDKKKTHKKAAAETLQTIHVPVNLTENCAYGLVGSHNSQEIAMTDNPAYGTTVIPKFEQDERLEITENPTYSEVQPRK